MFNTGFPTTVLSWQDKSAAKSDVLFSAPKDGLNVPFFFTLAERGIPGQIYFGAGKELTPVFGDATFTPGSPYYTASSEFASRAMAGQGVEMMRLVDSAATFATVGLFLSVKTQSVPQYKKDTTGTRLVDVNGNYIPKVQSDGTTVVSEPGVSLKWSVRQILPNENYTALTPTVSTTGGVTTTTYPILAFRMLWQGLAGNRQGFSLYSTGTQSSSIEQAIGASLYRFVPMELPTAISAIASYLPDVFGSSYNDVAFKPNAIYAGTGTNYSFQYILGNAYVNADDGNTTLPYNVQVYSNNVKTIGQTVLAVSPELGAIDPYLVDLIACSDASGNLYDHVALDPLSSTVVNSSIVNYAIGGSDGDTSWAKFDTLVANWLAGNDHGEFGNVQQHPMTHFSDPGFSISTKYLLFNMLNMRDNFKIDVSTQDIALPINTKAQDFSTGQALMIRAQLHPESVINGVGCCRVGIYAHASTLVGGSPYGGNVPFTLNRLIQRRDLDGGSYIKGSAGGLPNSQVTLFRKPNWVADDDATQKLFWASSINTVRHADRTTIFYPALRTIYPNDTSLLVDDELADRCVYMIKIVRRIWAKYAGVRRPTKKLYPLIQDDINHDCASAFSGDNINVQATVFQTALDANLGYAVSVGLAITGTPALRVFNMNIEVDRAVD